MPVDEKEIKERPMTAYFDLENRLYKENKPIEIKSAMVWGALTIVQQVGCITWDTQRELYGEFMSKSMNLR